MAGVITLDGNKQCYESLISQEIELRSGVITLAKINKQYNTIHPIEAFGAVSDCNYYNDKDNKYYKDKAFTQLATDNTKAFQKAMDSGYNIQINGNYLVSSPVIIEKNIIIQGDNGNIYTESNDANKGSKSLFIIKSPCKIKNLKLYSKNNQELEMYKRKEDLESEYSGESSNVIGFNIQSSDVYINSCSSNELEDLVHCYVENDIISNIHIYNCAAYKSFIGYGFGNAKNVFIENNLCTMEKSLNGGTPHALYIWGGCDNIQISNCNFYNTCNMISLLRVRNDNGSITVENCMFVNTEGKSCIPFEIASGNNNMVINNCKSYEFRLCFSSLGTGSLSVLNSYFFNDITELEDNCISDFIGIFENRSANIKVDKSIFELRFDRQTSLKPQRSQITNCTFEFSADTESIIPIGIENPTEATFINTVFDCKRNVRFYLYGIGGSKFDYCTFKHDLAYGIFSYTQQPCTFNHCTFSGKFTFEQGHQILNDCIMK